MAIVILMMGWAVTRWWNSDIHAASETVTLCGWILCGLVIVLSLLWLGNSLEQRLKPARTHQAETWLDWKTFIAVGIAIMATKAGERAMQPERGLYFPLPAGSSVTQQLRGQIANPDSANFALQQGRTRQATATYWKNAVANLHGIRFRRLTETDSMPEVFERLTRDLQQQVEQARAASTAHVDLELLDMVQRHLEQDDRLLTVLAQIPQLMQAFQVDWGNESAGQRALQWQQIQARLIVQPELMEKLPPEAQQLINDVVALEEQQQAQFREIELLQAILRERYRGVAFPLPPIDP
ncbi:hypothetical protein [Planctellipticum variicoloris]|uniref:hypothetical protein n=1 Tax=Planctellipticum variicoloris TaxID=3064265 RepID=UPI003013FF8C|nr:hypothetical protein SH412_005310 [Planctomycetaceae bacterium SH412]